METTRVSAVANQPVALVSLGTRESSEHLYEGIRLVTDDPGKLVPFVDQILFFLRMNGWKTRPVTICESKGVAEIRWSGRRPKAFRDRLVLCVSEGQHVDLFQVAAA
jgi:hypothetical protein